MAQMRSKVFAYKSYFILFSFFYLGFSFTTIHESQDCKGGISLAGLLMQKAHVCT